MTTGRRLMLVTGVLALGVGAWAWRAQAQRSALRRWAALDAGEVGAFWNCLFARPMDAGDLANGQQARRLAETAYAGEKQAFPHRLVRECLPRLERARRSLDQLGPATPALTRYRQSLLAVHAATRLYGQRLAGRPATRELDETIVDAARDWYGDPARPRAVAYERFLDCAVPDLDDLDDDPALYRHLAARCFAADPLPYMNRVRRACAPLLQLPAQAPSPSYARTRRRFHGADAVQISSWDSCSDIARAEERLGDGAELVRATDAYLETRPRSRSAGPS
jgi:hypothetical protein